MPFRYTSDESKAARQAVTQAAHELVRKQFGILDRHLDGREYMLDGGRSVVDAYAFPMMRWARKLLPGGLDAFPNVQALHDRLAGDPAVQKVLAREARG
jgi:glutathione S-transferase